MGAWSESGNNSSSMTVKVAFGPLHKAMTCFSFSNKIELFGVSLQENSLVTEK